MPEIAIIGRQNVGKSTLFNSLIGKRKSIVFDRPGVTRDMISEPVEWGEGNWTLTDFPGFEQESELRDDELSLQSVARAKDSLNKYNLLLWVVSVRNVTGYEHDLARELRKIKKPVWLVVNFTDDPSLEHDAEDIYKLGIKPIYFVSALNHRNILALRDALRMHFTGKKILTQEEPPNVKEIPGNALKIAIIGKPNAGKSTLFNQFMKKDLAMVSEIAGTTRDVLTEWFSFEDTPVYITDTAGLRRKRNITDSVEYYSVERTKRAMESADVVILLIDPFEAIDKQNKTIFQTAADAGKPVIAGINKADIFKDPEKKKLLKEELAEYQKSFWEFPWYFISAADGTNMHKLIKKGFALKEKALKKITTPRLNDMLTYLKRNNILSNYGIKLNYITQGSPGTKFIIFANKPVPVNVKKYLVGNLQKQLEWEEIPVTVEIRNKYKK